MDTQNNGQMDESWNDGGFPEVTKPNVATKPQEQKSRNTYKNELFANDSVTRCSGFINEVRTHKKGEDTLYFMRVGLIQGSRQNEVGEWEGDITNCDLLVGSTLKKWAEQARQYPGMMNGVRINFTIRNLKFIPGIYENKPVLSSKGILETISIGQLD